MDVEVTVALRTGNDTAGPLKGTALIHTTVPGDAAAAASAVLTRITESVEFRRLFQDIFAFTPGHLSDYTRLQRDLDYKIRQIERDLHFKIVEAVRDVGLSLKSHPETFLAIKAEAEALIQAAYAYATHNAGKMAGLDEILALNHYIAGYKTPTDVDYAYSALSTLFKLFEGANRVMERQGKQGYRTNRNYATIRQILIEQNKLPKAPTEDSDADAAAWKPTTPEPRPISKRAISAGEEVTVNPLGAALLNLARDRGMVYLDIQAEREKQQRKHYTDRHDEDHSANDWLAIILRESAPLGFADDESGEYRAALIKVAAVAVAAVEAHDRQYGAPGEKVES